MSKEEILNRTRKNRIFLDSIINRKINWIERNIRGNGILTTVFEGTVEGKRRSKRTD